MKIGGLVVRSLSFCRLLALCTVSCLLFFGTQVAHSQSSLESDVDNARIIEMTHKGLGDDVIIARIKASATKFSLSDDDLAALKKAGVSDSVVAAMIQSTQLTKSLKSR